MVKRGILPITRDQNILCLVFFGGNRFFVIYTDHFLYTGVELHRDCGGSWFCYVWLVKEVKDYTSRIREIITSRNLGHLSYPWCVIFISLVCIIVCFCISPLYIVRQILGLSHAFSRGLFITRDCINTLFKELGLITTLLPSQVSFSLGGFGWIFEQCFSEVTLLNLQRSGVPASQRRFMELNMWDVPV